MLVLRRSGYRFLAARLKTPRAELDLVLVGENELVVVEVKTGRAGSNFRPGEHFSPSARSRQIYALQKMAQELGLGKSTLLLAEVMARKGGAPGLTLTTIHTSPK